MTARTATGAPPAVPRIDSDVVGADLGVGAGRCCRAPRGAVRLLPALLVALAVALPFAGFAPAAYADAITYADVSDQAAQPFASAQEGAGGTRIATPYYAVFLEDGMFPDGFAYAYTEELDGAYGVLDVYAATSRTSEGGSAPASSAVPGQPAYRFYCVADGTSDAPFAGTYATASFVADGTVVMVARPYGAGFAAADAGAYAAAAEDSAALRSAAPSAKAVEAFGSDDVQAAQDLAVAMAGHVSVDTATHMVANADGSTSIVTPWYTVTIPYNLFPGGWYYSYSDAMVDQSGTGTAYWGRVLDVYAVGQGLVFSVYCGKDAGPQGPCIETRVAELGGDWAGWHVGVFADAGGDGGASSEELARLESYAALVAVADDPGMNPPDLP